MSLWQRWQASDSMKYLLGIWPLWAVCDELGKNGPLGPSPSPSMEVGGAGFTIRYALSQRSCLTFHPYRPRAAASPRKSATRAAESTIFRFSQPLEPAHFETRSAIPAR